MFYICGARKNLEIHMYLTYGMKNYHVSVTELVDL